MGAQRIGAPSVGAPSVGAPSGDAAGLGAAASAQVARARRSDWWIAAGLVALSLGPAMAGAVRLAELAGGARITPANARFFAMPWPVSLHLLAVMPFSLLGALQFVPSFRRRHRAWHRVAGMVLVVCGVLTACTGLWMAQYYPWPPGDGVGLYRFRLLVGMAMLLSIAQALRALRHRNFAVHGEWMLRAYAIGMGAGTQVLTHLPYFLLVGTPDESARTVLMGAGWIINAIVAEWIIRGGARRRRALRGLAVHTTLPGRR